MQPLLSTPWDGLIPTKRKVPTFTLVHTAKTTFVNGVNPFLNTPPEDLWTTRRALRYGELSRAAFDIAMQYVNENPGATAASVTLGTKAPKDMISRALRKLAKRGDIEVIHTVHEGVRKYVYWPKGGAPAAMTVPTLEQKILAGLESNPGMGGRQLADLANSEATFSMLAKLIKSGRIRVEGTDRLRRYYATGVPATPKKRGGGANLGGSIPPAKVQQLREQRAAGTTWNDLIQQHKLGPRAMFDAVKGIGAYRETAHAQA